MAVTMPGKIDPQRGVTLEILGIPAQPFDPTFDSSLILHPNGSDNHTLTLVLKIFLNPTLPPSAHVPPQFRVQQLDSDNKVFNIKPWQQAELVKFQKTFLRECALWTNKFWLQPPAGFSLLDVQTRRGRVRPNIYCHLYIDLVGGTARSHRAVTVVNLAATPGLPDPSTFRSNDRLYKSSDTAGQTNHWQDDHNVAHDTHQSTIAHEIGHALGLPHIGQTSGDPLCQLAIIADAQSQVDPTFTVPALYLGGSNSNPCYGTLAPVSDGTNIMGFGSSFDKSNAQPWVDRIALHTGTAAAAWQVSRTRIAPKFV
jgi:hypothetical protein